MTKYEVSVQDNGLVILLYGRSYFHCITHPDNRPYLSTTNHMKKNATWGIHYTTIPDSHCLASQIEFDWYVHHYEQKHGSLNVCNSNVWNIISSVSKKMSLPKECNCISIEYSNLRNNTTVSKETSEVQLPGTPPRKRKQVSEDDCHTIEKKRKTTTRQGFMNDAIEIDETYMFTKPFSKKVIRIR